MTPAGYIDAAKRIVIKIGSVLVADPDTGAVYQEWLASIAEDISVLHKQGKQVLLVTSGAIALGRKSIGIAATDRPSSIPLEEKQAAASVGQVQLSLAYDRAFSKFGITTSLVLLTPRDTEDRRSHLNARATIDTLLSHGIIPVVNENDTVSTSEIRFGDNDRLAARVAQMIGADLLIQFSTTDGLYTADPRVNPAAEHIPVVETLSADIRNMAGDALPGLSTGGMKSKLVAAEMAAQAGVPMVIAKGVSPHPLRDLREGARATLFLPQGTPLSARKKWIQAHVKPAGSITIDDGAAKALRDGKSLLPAGIKTVSGDFDRGDAVTVMGSGGNKIGVGLAVYSAGEADKIKGHKTSDISALLGFVRRDEFIHRDDLVILS